MKYIPIIVIIFCSLLFIKCESSTEPKHNSSGELEITVLDRNSTPVSDAVVFIKDAELESKTDLYGKVLFENISGGRYEVFAYKLKLGSGKSYIQVSDDKLNKEKIDFVYGKYFEPLINFQAPSNSYYNKYVVGDSIRFVCSVQDNYTPAESIIVSLTSNISGLLTESYPNKGGKFSYTTASLPKGQHKIKVKAIDKNGYVGVDSIFVNNVLPPRVSFLEPIATDSGFTIRWTVCEDPDFQKYELYQNSRIDYSHNEIKIATITNKDVAFYFENNPPLVDSIFYKVVAYNQQGERTESEYLKVFEPAGKLFDYTLIDAVINPTSDLIYFSTNNYDVIAFNYKKGTEVGKVRYTTSLGFMDIGDNGSGLELYVPDHSGYINIYDPENLQKISTINCTMPVYSCTIDEKGFVYTSTNSYNNSVKSYDRITGDIISDNGQIRDGNLRLAPNKMDILNVGSYGIEIIKLGENGIIKNSILGFNHSNYSVDKSIFKISPDGSYLLTSSKGSIFSTKENIEYLGVIPGGTVQFSDFDFSKDGKIIYAASSNNKFINVYSYPDMNIEKKIATKGFPAKIFRKNDKLIVISKSISTSYYNNSKILFEIFDIEE